MCRKQLLVVWLLLSCLLQQQVFSLSPEEAEIVAELQKDLVAASTHLSRLQKESALQMQRQRTLSERILELQKEQNGLKSYIDNLESQSNSYEQQIELLKKDLAISLQTLEKLQAEIQLLMKKAEQLTQELNDVSSMFKDYKRQTISKYAIVGVVGVSIGVIGTVILMGRMQ